MDNCIFCKIVKGEIPSSKVYEDEHSLAFLDIAPVHKGHTLVIPKRHFEDLTKIPEKDLQELIKSVKKVSIAVEKAVKADGFNLNISNKKAAGQVIFHAHFHIIPRFENDGLKLWPKGFNYKEGEMQEFAKKIEKNIE